MFHLSRLSVRSTVVYPIHSGPCWHGLGTWCQPTLVCGRHSVVSPVSPPGYDNHCPPTRESCISDVGHWMAANRLKLNTDKTELLWAGSKRSFAPLGSKGPPLQPGSEVIAASDHVRRLGVTISSDLSLQMHVSSVCSSCFYWLRQIRRIRRSLDTEFARVPHVLGCEPLCTGCQNLHPPSPFIIIT